MNILQFRKTTLLPLYEEYVKEDREPLLCRRSGYIRKVTPFNTEPCRKYLENILNKRITNEDILWCYYHIGNEVK